MFRGGWERTLEGRGERREEEGLEGRGEEEGQRFDRAALGNE